MARAPSISMADVEQAVARLQQRKEAVTPYRIRKILGHGSYRTIEEYLARLQHPVNPESPGDLSAYLSRLIQPFAEQMLQDIREPFDQERDKLETEIASLKSALQDATHELASQQTRIQEQETALSESEAAIDAVRAELIRVRSSLEKQVVQLTTEKKDLARENHRIRQQVKDQQKHHHREIEQLNERHQAHIRDLQTLMTRQLDEIEEKDALIEAMKVRLDQDRNEPVRRRLKRSRRNQG